MSHFLNSWEKEGRGKWEREDKEIVRDAETTIDLKKKRRNVEKWSEKKNVELKNEAAYDSEQPREAKRDEEFRVWEHEIPAISISLIPLLSGVIPT